MEPLLINKPASLTHLVGFALKLRNLGISDHGLIRELSSPLAGSLYSGEGHSRIYEDDAVYEYVFGFELSSILSMMLIFALLSVWQLNSHWKPRPWKISHFEYTEQLHRVRKTHIFYPSPCGVSLRRNLYEPSYGMRRWSCSGNSTIGNLPAKF